MSTITITPQTLEHWVKYEKVRASGRYNMFDARARAATGLERDDFLFVIEHFDELEQAFIDYREVTQATLDKR